MSFCRWSSDDFLCDLYCYESNEGYETHVAGNRRVYRTPLPEPVTFDPESSKFFDRMQAIMDMEEGKDFDYEPIGLEFDNQSFCDPDVESFIDTLEMLQYAGYRFPYELIDELKKKG